LSTAAALREAGHRVRISDEHLREPRTARIVAETAAANPDLLLICQNDYNRKVEAPVLERLVAALRAALPDTPLAAFGRLDAAHARTALTEVPSLPAILYGEPEFSAVAFADGKHVGCMRRDGDEIVDSPPTSIDLDSLPFPAWDLVDIHDYGFSPHQEAGDTVYPILASRGCPFPCFYCEVRIRPGWITRSVDSILAELRWLRDEHGTRAVFFADPTFAVDRDWALELCRRLPAEGPPNLRWSCMSRTDRVDPELLQAMADAGCWNILFGIESLNPVALVAARKNMDPATVEPAIQAAKAAGIEVIASIMVGLPGDTPEGFEDTLQRVIAMQPDFAQFFVTQITPDVVPETGRLASEWEGSRYDFFGRVYLPDGFESAEQLAALRRRAFKRFYLRPAYVAHTARRLLRSGDVGAQLVRAARGGLLAARLVAGGRS
jgi:radical SAM superfamily enzyme YgiQ (UPF0313 family)